MRKILFVLLAALLAAMTGCRSERRRTPPFLLHCWIQREQPPARLPWRPAGARVLCRRGRPLQAAAVPPSSLPDLRRAGPLPAGRVRLPGKPPRLRSKSRRPHRNKPIRRKAPAALRPRLLHQAHSRRRPQKRKLQRRNRKHLSSPRRQKAFTISPSISNKSRRKWYKSGKLKWAGPIGCSIRMEH